MNRVEDSLLLWRSIVANKLLSRVNIILFLNKCDLLQVGLLIFGCSVVQTGFVFCILVHFDLTSHIVGQA